MSYKLTNNSGGQIVCSLSDKKKTLRLDNKQYKTIGEDEITPHIENLIKKGLLLSEKVSSESKQKIEKVKKESVIKNRGKEKED